MSFFHNPVAQVPALPYRLPTTIVSWFHELTISRPVCDVSLYFYDAYVKDISSPFHINIDTYTWLSQSYQLFREERPAFGLKTAS
jgi:hypothetical protein